MTDDVGEDDRGVGREVEQDQLRALKRLEADADAVALADGFGMPLAAPGTDLLADLTPQSKENR